MRCILFDLDGTLTDTFELWYRCVHDLVLKHAGRELSKDEYARKYWGMDSRSKIRELITTEPQDVEKLYAELQTALIDNIQAVTAFPGISDAIRSLSKRYPLAAISNSSIAFMQAQLEHTGLMGYFTVLIADALPKPSPEGLLRAIRELGCAPQDALFVGDSRFDTAAGKAAGIRTLLIGKDIAVDELGKLGW